MRLMHWKHYIIKMIILPNTSIDAMQFLSRYQKHISTDVDEIILKFVYNWVQFSRSVVSDSLRPHESQHTRPPCPSPTPGVHPDSQHWVSDAIQPSHPLSSPSPPAPNPSQPSGSFQMSQLFTSGGQSIGVSTSASVLPMNTQDWFPLEWTGWISLQSKGVSRVFSNTTVQKHQFFSAQLSSQSNSHIHTWPQEKPQPWRDGPLLAK